MKPPIRVVQNGFPGKPDLDTAVSRALLVRASEGTVSETFRLHVPGRVVAFGKRDKLSPGYTDAVAAARAAGFVPIERLVGGRAAVFHEGVLALSWSMPEANPRGGIHERFVMLANMMVGAFTRMGIQSEIGELPGEYCPGAFSIHSGSKKVMGIGQRLARCAAQIGGVVVVSGGRIVRDALVPVYEALDLEWEPSTAGSLQDVAPGVTLQETAAAILSELDGLRSPVHDVLDDETVDLARRLAPEHVPA